MVGKHLHYSEHKCRDEVIVVGVELGVIDHNIPVPVELVGDLYDTMSRRYVSLSGRNNEVEVSSSSDVHSLVVSTYAQNAFIVRQSLKFSKQT